MNIAIKVNSVNDGEGAVCAPLEFIRGALREGHTILRVFFYHDGIHEAYGPDLKAWEDVATAGCFELVICSHATMLRGRSLSPQKPFIVGGLGLWVDACIKADRVVTFGSPSFEA